jgi:hypothetical protein
MRLLRYSSGIEEPALVLKKLELSSGLGLAGFVPSVFAVPSDDVASAETSGDGGRDVGRVGSSQKEVNASRQRKNS